MRRPIFTIFIGLNVCVLGATKSPGQSIIDPDMEEYEEAPNPEDGNYDEIYEKYFETIDPEAEPETEVPEQPLSAQATSDDPAAASDATPTTPTPPTTPPATSTTPPATTTTPGPKPKKVVRKKKKKIPATAAGETTPIEGATGHGAQDSGLPYKANVDLGFSFSSQSLNLKYSNETKKISSTEIELDLAWLFIVSRMEIGPRVNFTSMTQKEGSVVALKESGFGIGGVFFFNFGNIHTDKFVPYLGTALIISSLSSTMPSAETDGAEDKVTVKTTDMGLQFGMKYFVGAHLALKPFFTYDLTINGERREESAGASATVGALSGGTMRLGLGLAKYF